MTDNTTAPGGDDIPEIFERYGISDFLDDDQIELVTAALNAYILAEVLALIGEDENDTADDGEIMRDPVMRNRLREQQRQAAIARFGKGGNDE